MKSTHNKPDPIDDLFRRELADHEITPPTERRSAFLEEAGKIAGKQGHQYRWIVISLIMILVAAISGILLFMPANKMNTSQQPVKDKVTPPVSRGSSKTQKALPVQSNSPVFAQQTSHYTPAKTYGVQSKDAIAPDGTKIPGMHTLNSQQTIIDPHLLITPVLQSRVSDSTSIPEEKDSTVGIQIRQVAENEIPPAKPAILNTPVPPPDQNMSSTEPVHAQQAPRDNSWNIDAGIYYSPEWMFNMIDGDKYVNNFGIEGSFHFGPYSMRTGVGLSITKGSNEIQVGTNSYLGEYKALDSIAFKWDDTYHLVPTYYFTGKEVFDTGLNYNYNYVVKQYTYVQVPLILGYDFIRKNRFSTGIRMGAIMSLLLKENILTESYDPGKDRIITINNITPDKIQMNWQAIGGLNVSYRFSDRLKLELEPEVRYYFNSVYEQADIAKKPWSVGFRAAFIVVF